MKISQIIQKLAEIRERFGDLDVTAATADFEYSVDSANSDELGEK
jgi:hypothetical protein